MANETVESAENSVEDTFNDLLEMSDADFAEAESKLNAVDYSDDSEEAPASEEEAEDDIDGEGTVDEEENSSDVEDDESDTTGAESNESDPGLNNDEGDAADDATDETTGDVNYKSQVEKLLSPFKANGRQIQVKNVEDAILLMQKGANYNQKMAGMKPAQKALKLLQNNDLLDEGKLEFLVALDKKDPNAIAKLLKDNDIDPLQIDLEVSDKYQAEKLTVDDLEIELDNVLEDLKGSDTYTQTLDIVSSVWDDASKKVIRENPQLLKLIDNHVATGIYEIVSNEVANQRMIGNLIGKSDIEAHKEVGDAIQERGGFDHLFSSEEPVQSTPASRKKAAPKPGDKSRRDKRRAASPTKKSVSDSGPAQEFNPLALSDEEFMKQADAKFM